MAVRALVMPRGINVGGRNRVPMAELRSLLESQGFSDVVTIGQSGNVVVTTEDKIDQLGARISALIEEGFGVAVTCAARSAKDLRRILDRDPLSANATDGSKYLVTFLSTAPSPEQAGEILQAIHAPEAADVNDAEVYLWHPEGVLAMTWSYAKLEKYLGCTATARNWNTLEKIVAAL